MSFIDFEYDKSSNLCASGSLFSLSKIAQTKNLGSLIRALAETVQQLLEYYTKALVNDNTIVGIERSDLIEQADTAILLLIAMCKNLETEKKRIIIKLPDKPCEMDMYATIEGENWNIAGGTPHAEKRFSTLNEFYTNALAPTFTAFLTTYRNAATDGQLDKAEKSELMESSKELLSLFVTLRYLLSSCSINN